MTAVKQAVAREGAAVKAASKNMRVITELLTAGVSWLHDSYLVAIVVIQLPVELGGVLTTCTATCLAGGAAATPCRPAAAQATSAGTARGSVGTTAAAERHLLGGKEGHAARYTQARSTSGAVNIGWTSVLFLYGTALCRGTEVAMHTSCMDSVSCSIEKPTLQHLLHPLEQQGAHLAMPMLAAAWPHILEAPPVSSLGRPTLQHVQPSSSQLVAQLQHSPAQQTAS